MVWQAFAGAAAKYVLPAILTGISSGISSGIGRRVEGAFLKRADMERPSYIGSPNFGPQYLMAGEQRAFATQMAEEERKERAADRSSAIDVEEARYQRSQAERKKETQDAYDRQVELERQRAANQISLAILQDALAGKRMEALRQQEITARMLENPYEYEPWYKRMGLSFQDFLEGKGQGRKTEKWVNENVSEKQLGEYFQIP